MESFFVVVVNVDHCLEKWLHHFLFIGGDVPGPLCLSDHHTAPWQSGTTGRHQRPTKVCHLWKARRKSALDTLIQVVCIGKHVRIVYSGCFIGKHVRIVYGVNLEVPSSSGNIDLTVNHMKKTLIHHTCFRWLTLGSFYWAFIDICGCCSGCGQMFDGRCGRIPAVDGPFHHYDESHLLLTPENHQSCGSHCRRTGVTLM